MKTMKNQKTSSSLTCFDRHLPFLFDSDLHLSPFGISFLMLLSQSHTQLFSHCISPLIYSPARVLMSKDSKSDPTQSDITERIHNLSRLRRQPSTLSVSSVNSKTRGRNISRSQCLLLQEAVIGRQTQALTA